MRWPHRFSTTRSTSSLALKAGDSFWVEPLRIDSAPGSVQYRKPGKLPSKTLSESYALEYGTDALEVHHDAILSGERVAIVDDVIATGGTAQATVALVRRLGGDLRGLSFLIELAGLNGRARLAGERLHSILTY